MKNTWMWITKFFVVICVILAGIIYMPWEPAYAAIAPIKVVSVEYYEEQIVVQNNDNSKICFATESDAARNNWEVMDADSGDYTTIDMSWLSSTTENTIVLKGYNDSTNTVSRVVLKAKPTKLTVGISYTYLDALNSGDNIAPLVNIMTTEGTGNDPIDFTDLEWRKGETGQWKNTEELTAASLEKFLVKGTNLYFRIRAKDDVINIKGKNIDFDQLRAGGEGGLLAYLNNNKTAELGTDFPDGTEGRRFSNEVKVRVAKKSVATGYGIDGSKFTADIKYGKEYRVTNGTGLPSEWVKVFDRTVRALPLATIINSSDNSLSYDGTIASKAFPAMKIEVRDYATSKAASSKITEVSLNAQRTITDAILQGPAPGNAASADSNIYVSYNGTKNIILEIPSASSAQPYEYTVVKPNETLNLAKAAWTAVTKGTEIKILSGKAVNKGTLYVRMKEIKAKKATATTNATSYELASTYVYTNITYPSIPDIINETIAFTKGYSTDVPFTVTLGDNPFETEIKSIKLGTKDIEFSQVLSAGTTKTISVILKANSLNSLSNCYGKPIIITYKNGTIDKTSLKLTIQNSAPAGALTVIHAKATNTTGGTAFTIVTAKGTNNKWLYVITDAAITGVNIQDKISDKTTAAQNAIASASVNDLPFTAGKYLTIFEVNSSDDIVKYKSIQITSDYIK